jgi:hypothetical protein
MSASALIIAPDHRTIARSSQLPEVPSMYTHVLIEKAQFSHGSTLLLSTHQMTATKIPVRQHPVDRIRRLHRNQAKRILWVLHMQLSTREATNHS